MNIKELKESLIFRGMSDQEIKEAIENLYSKEKVYQKGTTIFFAGKKTETMGLVLEGSVKIESNNARGDRSILTKVDRGGYFAESYAVLKDEPMLVNVTANEDTRVLFLRIGNLKNLILESKLWKQKLLLNLLAISAEKNLALSKRSLHISSKTIRGRVMAYLSDLSIKKGEKEFDIPFDRQAMADYLNLDRSALSKELGKMQKEGLISFKKNHFIIKEG
jgi:CRP-like cAMP-binding protein